MSWTTANTVTPPRPRARRAVVARLRYVLALISRFRATLAATAALLLGAPAVFMALYRSPEGARIGFGEAFHHVYFLFFGQPSLPYVDNAVLEVLNLLLPPLGIAVVVDGIIRFVLLALARESQDKEWIAVLTQGFERHVIVCGAGRVGYRVAQQIAALGRDVVVIEKREDAPFVTVLRDQGIPVLIDDIRSRGALQRTHAGRAAAIVACTDDDLANLNVCLDARRLNADVQLVIRLFDEDLAATVRDTLHAETLSTSSMSAPALALAAIDPRIQHSFRVGKHLMVVSSFIADDSLAKIGLATLRERFGAHALAITGLDGHERLHPPDATPLAAGDRLVLQCDYPDYLVLRTQLSNGGGEATPTV